MEDTSRIGAPLSSIALQQVQKEQLRNWKKIGSGGFGIVYKAENDRMGCVAVKKCKMRHNREVKGLLKPGLNNIIVQILGWIQATEIDSNSYIIMEYMEHGSLKEFSRNLQPFPNSLKMRMISEVIQGMFFLHSVDMIHRDLKLENIFVGKGFSLKIGDLGLAVWQSAKDSTKGTVGTLTHIAPENFDINMPATDKSDVYSFGITLWELSTGKDPYENALNEGHIRTSVLKGQRPDMKCFPRDELPIIKDIMLRAWNQTPAERPTFLEFKKEIEEEYDAKYKNDINNDLSMVYKQPFLAQRKETCEGNCAASCSKDNPDSSSRLFEDGASMKEGSNPSPLRSTNPSRTREELGIAVQPEFGVDKESAVSTSQSGLAPTNLPTEEFLGGKAVQPESDHDAVKESGNPSQRVLIPEESKQRIPTQESQHGNPETSTHSSFQNQPQSQQQTGHNPQQNYSMAPRDPWSQGFNLNVTGDGHTVILAGTGSTVTMHGQKKTGKGKKWTERQDSPSSSDSECDDLDPKVQEIQNSSEVLKEKHIHKLSEHIGRKWKKLGRKLGLKDVMMENIEYDHHLGGQQEMAYQVILTWMRKKGRAKKGELAEALVDVGLSKVALKLN